MTKETTAAVADFSAFFLEETARLELELPTGEPMLHGGKPVAVNLYGPATKQFVKARTAMEKDASNNIMRAMGNARNKKTDDDNAESDAKYLVAVTADFENFPYPGGADAIYREPRLKYIANQVRAHLNDLGNFFKESRKS